MPRLQILQTIVTTFGTAFKLTLQLGAALVVYSLTVNLAFGFLNKMVPQIPIYFVSTPFVVLGGLIILLQIDKYDAGDLLVSRHAGHRKPRPKWLDPRRKLRRLVDVFHDLETVERAKVGELTREMNELRTAQDEILASLAKPTAFHGQFVALLSGRVGSLERRLQRLAGEREIALRQYAEAARRKRSAAELLAKARAEEARKFEQAELEALLEFQEATAAQGRCKSPRST